MSDRSTARKRHHGPAFRFAFSGPAALVALVVALRSVDAFAQEGQPIVAPPAPSTAAPPVTAVTSPAAITTAADLAARAEDPAATANDSAAADAPPPTFLGSLWEAVSQGKPELDLRLRAEVVEQDFLDTAHAMTSRLRLGYGTRPFHGVSVYAEAEDIRALDDDRYNAAGFNANPGKAAIADIQDTELNQGYVKYANELFTGIAGRQRIVLDDHRFIGNVGWRQNEQTFDALTLRSDWLTDTSLFYGYVSDVNRVFGPDADADFESDSHLLEATYRGLPCADLTVFAYLFDFDDSPANSSNTYGFRATGSQEIVADLSLDWQGSYAHQYDAADNPFDYDADYVLFEALLAKQGVGDGGVGYEFLGSDAANFAFRTPLATLHAFNGWADVFTVTPAAGLQDLYLTAGAKLPCEFGLRGTFHWFWTDETNDELGQEFDASVSKALSKHVRLLVKSAVFDGRSGLADLARYWLQMEISF